MKIIYILWSYNRNVIMLRDTLFKFKAKFDNTCRRITKGRQMQRNTFTIDLYFYNRFIHLQLLFVILQNCFLIYSL